MENASCFTAFLILLKLRVFSKENKIYKISFNCVLVPRCSFLPRCARDTFSYTLFLAELDPHLFLH